MPKLVIGFSGRIGSGKTTLSRKLARQLGWLWTGFGDYVRAVARSRGLDTQSRQVLQSVGAEIIADKGLRNFCQEVLSWAGWLPGDAIVIDGIRFGKAIEHISECVAPMRFVLVHLKLGDQTQAQRIAGRGAEDLSGLLQAETHFTEREVLDELPRHADLILEAELPLHEQLSAIRTTFNLQWVQ